MEIEGFECNDKSVADTGISQGELYMAKRNTGWHLLECKKYEDGVVYPTGIGYPYNAHECFKVK